MMGVAEGRIPIIQAGFRIKVESWDNLGKISIFLEFSGQILYYH